jgi:hypothetical protein
MNKWRLIVASGLLCALVACSNESSSSSSSVPGSLAAGTTTATDHTTPATVPATVPVTDAPTTAAPAPTWEAVTAPSNCMCSDGSTFTYYVHRADPNKVMFFLEGGGACFSADTCGPASGSFKRAGDTLDDMNGLQTGIFSLDDPRNPFRGWSIVYVPYCTGDVHLGNTTHDYGNGVVVQHKGYVNASTALSKMAELFPEASQLVVTGESAGSVPTPLYAGMAHDLLPAAKITVLADGSGAYPDIPAINTVIGGAWGTVDAIPPWPENAGQTAATWSFPGLFVQAGKHDKDIVFARHDYAFDKTQAFFAGLAGIDANNLVTLIDKNETEVEASGITLLSYIAGGNTHTVLGRPAFYTETVNGVKFVDWVTALVNGTTLDGKPLADDHCVDCTVAG